MKKLPVLKVISAISVFLAVFMLLPLAVSIILEDGMIWNFIISIMITGGIGGILWFLTRHETQIGIREGFGVVTFGWIAMALFGSLPFMISGTIPSFTDAFFETMSGFTTTGSTILTDIESIPQSILFWRSETQWLGGMGIIVLSLAILPILGIGGMQMFKAEVPGPTADKITPRVRQTATILWGVYIIFTICEISLLKIGGMTFLDSVNHTFTTLATGGYSTKNTSIGYFDSSYIHWVIIVFMFLAGVNFSLHFRFLRGNFKALYKDREFLYYCGILGAASLIIMTDTLLRQGGSFFAVLRDSVFQTVSIGTTTGYGTYDYEKWSYLSQTILFFLMFIGGCAGSTGGGMKVIRAVLLSKYAWNELKKLVHPKAVIPVKLKDRSVPQEIMTKILGYFLSFVLIVVICVLIMSHLGLDFKSSFGAVAACIGNIGPGLGLVGPTKTFATIPVLGKWLLSFLMLLGRLELFTILVLFTPDFWKR